VNPVNANLEDYTLSFIGHTAQTRGEVNYLNPVEPQASKNYRDENDVLWVEFENSAEIYSKINKATRIPGFNHNKGTIEYMYENPNYTTSATEAPAGIDNQGEGNTTTQEQYLEGKIDYATSHYVYGEGKTYGQGVVTALVAENADEEGDASYVASDYALLVPVEINRLVLSSATHTGINETEYAKKDWVNTGYACVEPTNFHLYTVAKDRAQLGTLDNQIAIDKLKFDEEFDLTTLVETHYKTSLGKGASDQKVSDDLFRRLNLAYRFYPID
jgi:hypothetical protein